MCIWCSLCVTELLRARRHSKQSTLTKLLQWCWAGKVLKDRSNCHSQMSTAACDWKWWLGQRILIIHEVGLPRLWHNVPWCTLQWVHLCWINTKWTWRERRPQQSYKDNFASCLPVELVECLLWKKQLTSTLLSLYLKGRVSRASGLCDTHREKNGVRRGRLKNGSAGCLCSLPLPPSVCHLSGKVSSVHSNSFWLSESCGIHKCEESHCSTNSISLAL